MSGDDVIHFSQSNGLPVAHCWRGVYDYIVFTAPIDGIYDYKVTAHAWWANGDTEVGFYCNGSWRDPGMILGQGNTTFEGTTGSERASRYSSSSVLSTEKVMTLLQSMK